MVPDLMPFRKDLTDQLRPAAGPLSQQKKRGTDLVLAEDIQQGRRSFRMGAIVERQRDGQLSGE